MGPRGRFSQYVEITKQDLRGLPSGRFGSLRLGLLLAGRNGWCCIMHSHVLLMCRDVDVDTSISIREPFPRHPKVSAELRFSFVWCDR